MARWYCLVVQTSDGKYQAHMKIEGERVKGLPEHVDYRTLRKAIREVTGICILKRKDMRFERLCKKGYALIDATQRFYDNGDCRIRMVDFAFGTWKPAWDKE